MSKPTPFQVLATVAIALATASVVVIAITARRIPVPWQVVLVGAGAGWLMAMSTWFPSLARAVVIATAGQGGLALARHLYPATLRDDSSAQWQAAAILLLETIVIVYVMRRMGLLPKARERPFTLMP